MLRKKSTSPAMPLSQLAKHCSQLFKSKKFHTAEMLHYTRLFNQVEPDFSAGAPELTSEQKYYQLQVERHRAELARVEQAIATLEQTA